jgi:hypothetical protein
MDAVDARRLAFAPEQDEQPPITEAPPFVGEFAQPYAEFRNRL